MAGFVAIIHPPGRRAEPSRAFRGVVDGASAIFARTPAAAHVAPATRVATFARRDGTGGALVVDPVDGAWIAAIGTWFHDSGLSNGDETELLEIIRREGFARVAAEIDGAWALVLGRGERIDVATDLVGECRVYAARRDDAWILASSSLLLGATTGAELDPLGVQEFLCTGVIYEERSLFAGVHRLRGGRSTTFTAAACRELATWAPPSPTPELGLDEAADALHTALASAADRIAGRYGRVACDLTGGYDSRAVLSGFLAGGHRVSTTVRGEPDDADVVIADRIARGFGLPLQRYPGRIEGTADHRDDALLLTDGEYEIDEYAAVALLHEDLSRRHEISVNGSFGEMSRGYWFELLGRGAGGPGALDTRGIAAARYVTGAFDPTIFADAAGLDLVDHMAGVLQRADAGHERLPLGTRLTITYAQVRMSGWQARIASATNRIWPCVSPFLFRAAFDLPLRTEPEAMRHGRLVRRMLELRAPGLARVQLADGHPAELLRWRNAHRFAPWAARMAGKVFERAAGPVRRGRASGTAASLREPLSDRLAATGLFDRQKLETFLSAASLPGFGYHDQWLRLRTLDRCLAARERLAELAAGARDETAASA